MMFVKGMIPWNKGKHGVQKPSMLGGHHTEEAKQKIREARIGTHHSEETKIRGM